MSKTDLTVDEKYNLITSGLAEVLSPEIIKKILPERDINIYWGTATTGRPHAAYIVPAMKLAQFLKAGCTVKILLADLHAFLDADKAPEETLENRAQYYERTVRGLLKAVKVDISRLQFIRGSSYQLTPEYTRDLMRMSKKVSTHAALRAASEVVKISGEPCMADGLYPLMQILDEEYLDVDAEFGGLDQRKIFGLSHQAMPKMGMKTRCHLMNPMVPGLSGGKMSSSDPNSKIDLLDDWKTIKKKIAKAPCIPRVIEDNGIIAFIEHVIFPFKKLTSDNTVTVYKTRNSQEEPLVVTGSYSSFEELSAAYAEDKLTPQLVKAIVLEELFLLLQDMQTDFNNDPEWQEIRARAYTDVVKQQDNKKPAKTVEESAESQLSKRALKKMAKKSGKGNQGPSSADKSASEGEHKKADVIIPVQESA